MEYINGRKLRLLIDRESIRRRVKEIASEVENYFKEEEIVIIGLLKGAFIFTADIVRYLNRSVKIDFLWVSSYGSSMKSSGVIKIIKDIDMNIKGKQVLLVDDVLDSGLTLKEIQEFIRRKEPSIFATAVAVRKLKAENKDIKVEFVGFEVPNYFIVGYGMDWDEKGRHLADIYSVE